MDKRDIVQCVAIQIMDRETWINFALVCKLFANVLKIVCEQQKPIILKKDPVPRKCSKCRSKDVLIQELRFRTHDEIPTVLVFCRTCCNMRYRD